MRTVAALLVIGAIGVGVAGFVTLCVMALISALCLDLLVEVFDD